MISTGFEYSRASSLDDALDKLRAAAGDGKLLGNALGGRGIGDRLFGTAATVSAAVLRGADVVRVHDVREMSDVARMTDVLR